MTRPLYAHAVRILLALYLFEASVALLLIGLYKEPSYVWALMSPRAGAAIISGTIGMLASGLLLARDIRVAGTSGRRALALGLTANLLSGLIATLLLEATIRIVAKRTEEGIVVGTLVVRPTWSEVIAHSRAVIAAATPWGTWDATYFTYDPNLGWTVGSNRRSPDGLYFSSVEGIRSAGPDIRMADQTARFRVALIGDSNAFSFEVPFEDSWGHHLQTLLGDDVQVLNFGVDGYGIDQMYLRYQRDVQPWHPQVVIIGFIGHDLQRTMAVYPFVSFGWPGYLVKPRFAIREGALTLLNSPLPTPDAILGSHHIDELPFVDYDLGYETDDWHWRFDHGPLLLRVLASAYPRTPGPDPRISEEASMALNSRLWTELVGSIRKAGSVPIVVLMQPSARARQTLARAKIPYLEMTSCAAQVPANLRMVASGHHYTGMANQAIARCTSPAVMLALDNDHQELSGHSSPAHRVPSARHFPHS